MAIRWAILLFLFVALVNANPARNTNENTVKNILDDIDYRLPGIDKIKIQSYNLKLSPNFEDFTYDGDVDIKFNVNSDIDTITLHSKDLNITEPSYLKWPSQDSSPGLSQEGKHTFDTQKDFLIIKFPKMVTSTSMGYKLSIKFRGELKDDLRGFYRSYYTDSDGKKIWLAATHFEPVGARKAFPCFDEPELKAKFTIQIKHKANYEAISNMHYIRREVDAKTKDVLTTFAETPVMSTYLVAFVVSDFDYLENEKLTFKIWARKNVIQNGKYALKLGQHALEALENYTGITMNEMGFEKMENIAIPQFAAGAMENWGLVTYKENALLVEENVTKTSDKESVATVIAHEFAHQFFGNLVSPKWWTYVWLNEGFANYFQYLITQNTEPSWRILDLQLIENLQQTAFKVDSDIKAVSMNHAVNSPTEISNKFDSISYSKAGSVIRMISTVLGEKKFQEALKAYLNKMKEKSADSNDLFEEFKKVYESNKFTKEDFGKALINWAETPGFPVITVERDYVKNMSIITQDRFLLVDKKNNNDKYYVPLNMAQSPDDFNFTKITHWLKPEDFNISIPVEKDNTWIIFNKQQYGYYRVNYDERNWQLIIGTLKTDNYTNIHVLNRAQLVDDSLNLARIGKLDYQVVFDLISYLKHEKDYVPWYPAFKGFEFLDKMLSNSQFYKSFQKYVLNLLTDVENKLKYDPTDEDDHLTKYWRVITQSWACKLGSKTCTDDASAKLDKWMANPLSVPPDQKKVILCAGIRNVDHDKWHKLFDKYLESNDPDLLTALGCSKNKEILQHYLHSAANKSINFNKRENVFSAVTSGSAEGVDVALTFITNKNFIVNNITTDSSTIGTYFKNIGAYITTKEYQNKLEEFARHIELNLRDFPEEITQAVHESISNGKSNIKWIRKTEPTISKIFTEKEDKDESSDNNNSIIFTSSTILLVTSFIISKFY